MTVHVRGGVYRIERPLQLTPEDSRIRFVAAPGEMPIMDGGVRITGWRSTEANGRAAWVADVGELLASLRRPFRSLFVNGVRRDRTRSPRQGYLQVESVPGAPERFDQFAGTDCVVLPSGAFDSEWHSPTAIDMRVLHLWVDERMPVTGYDKATRVLTSRLQSVFMINGSREGWTKERVFFENIFEMMAEPGDWYLDEASQQLYYIPLPGQAPQDTEVVVPGVLQFIRLEGDPTADRWVREVEFDGIAFRYADWVQPIGDWRRRFDPYRPREDWRPRDCFEHFINNDRADQHRFYASAPQGAHNVPGAVFLYGVQSCAINRCTIEHVGFYGVDIGDGCSNNRFVGNRLHDLGAGGFNVDGGNYPSDPRRFTFRNQITDNVIQGAGRVFLAAVGVLLQHGFEHVIAHNEISDLPYSGVSVGWVWTREHHVSRDNVVEKNHIHDIGGRDLLSDQGAIYVLGVQPGTVVRDNLIRDVACDAYGGWGIYLDGDSANIVVEGNVIYDTAGEPFHNNMGNCENLCRNNVFVARHGPAVNVLRKPDEWPATGGPGRALTFMHNIVVTYGHPVFRFHASDSPNPGLYAQSLVSDANVFWDAARHGEPMMTTQGRGTAQFDLTQWREAGNDCTSHIEDPRLTVTPEMFSEVMLTERVTRQIGFRLPLLVNVGCRRASGDQAKTRCSGESTGTRVIELARQVAACSDAAAAPTRQTVSLGAAVIKAP